MNRLQLKCQFAGVTINRGEADGGGKRVITSDNETIPARLVRQPMWIFIRRQQDATDFARMSRIVYVQTYDGGPTFSSWSTQAMTCTCGAWSTQLSCRPDQADTP